MIASKRIIWIGGVCIALAVALVFALLYIPKAALKSNGISQGYESELFGQDIITVDIQMDGNKWEEMLKNAINEEYVSCDVKVNGTQYSNVAIRPKGNTSLSSVVISGSDRVSFKIKFDKTISGQTCCGLGELVLNNNFADATAMKEYLSYQLLDYMNVPSPLCTYANVTLNGEPWGLYLALEPIQEEFAARNFGSDYGQLYKPDRMDDRAGNKNMRNSGDLVYTDDEISSYSTIFDSAVFDTSDQDFERVITALKQLNLGEDLEKYINVDEVLRYFAVNTFLVNLDSYQGNLKHNYYLYEKNGILSIAPWDYNLSFGAYNIKSASDAVNFPVDTPYSGTTAEESPLLSKLLEVEKYNTLYHQYLQQIVDDYVNSGLFTKTVKLVDKRISSYVVDDPTAFYTLEQYQTGVDALKTYVLLRSQSVEGQLSGTVPSTGEAQGKSLDKLVDSSALNMPNIGQMNMDGQSKAVDVQGNEQNGQSDGAVPRGAGQGDAARGAASGVQGDAAPRGGQGDGTAGNNQTPQDGAQNRQNGQQNPAKQPPADGGNMPGMQRPQNRGNGQADMPGGAERTIGGKDQTGNTPSGQETSTNTVKEWLYDGAAFLTAMIGVGGMLLYRRRKCSKLK